MPKLVQYNNLCQTPEYVLSPMGELSPACHVPAGREAVTDYGVKVIVPFKPFCLTLFTEPEVQYRSVIHVGSIAMHSKRDKRISRSVKKRGEGYITDTHENAAITPSQTTL